MDRLLEISAGRRIGGFSSTYDDPLLARWACLCTACCCVYGSVCHLNLRQARADLDLPRLWPQLHGHCCAHLQLVYRLCCSTEHYIELEVPPDSGNGSWNAGIALAPLLYYFPQVSCWPRCTPRLPCGDVRRSSCLQLRRSQTGLGRHAQVALAKSRFTSPSARPLYRQALAVHACH